MTEALRQIQSLAAWFAVRMGDAAALPAGAAAGFDHALAALTEAPLASTGARGEALPVLRHWDAALAAAKGGPAVNAVGFLDALRPSLRWTQNPNYRAAPPSPGFLAEYGYAQLAGPPQVPTLLVTEACAFGLLLLGPGLLYPSHRHPAAELYLPLTEAEWQRGDGPWRRVPAGEPIHHPPHLAHATRAGETPLLALYLWQGDLATRARIGG